MMEQYLQELDLYQVDREDYTSYHHRLLKRNTELRQEGNLYYAYDLELNIPLCGIAFEDGPLQGKSYYIFEILDEELLSAPLLQKKVTLSQESYEKICEILSSQKGVKN